MKIPSHSTLAVLSAGMFAASFFVLPDPAQAEKAVLLADVITPSPQASSLVVDPGTQVIQMIAPFDTTQLTAPTAFTLTGFQAGDTRLVDIDFYPVNGVLYGLAASGNLYRITTSGPNAGQVNLAVTPTAPASGSPIADATNIDFNPAADRLRIFANGAGGATRTLRLTPNVFDNAGLVAGVTTDDGTLTFASGGAAGDLIGGNAYSNNVNGTASTTLFSIDLTTDNLLVNSTPAGGAAGSFSQLDLRGPLTLNGTRVDFGVGGVDNVGFDIAPGGTAYVSNGNTFYTVDLNTGALTLLGTVSSVGAFTTASVTTFALVTPPPAAPFFAGQAELNSGFYYLAFPNGTPFGYYSFTFYPFLYHDDLGFEYFVNANDGQNGAYLFDFKLGVFFYTNPTLFPYLYNFGTNSFFYYYIDTQRPGHYTTNPRVFFNFASGQFVYSP